MFHRRLLRVPWAVRRSNQTILKEINPEYSGLMLKLKLQYFGHLMGKTDSLEKTATGEGGDRGWDGWMASLTQWTWVCVASGSRWWTGKPGWLQSMGLQSVRHHWAIELTDCPIQKRPFQGKLPQNMFDKLKRISLKYIDILFISSFIWKLMKSHYKEHM